MTFGRILLRFLFVLSSLPVGVMVGAYIGSRYFVPGGGGLASPAIALYYGVIGAAIAGIIALILAIYLSRGWLLGISLPVIAIGLICALFFVTIYLGAKSKQEAHLEEAYEKLNRFEITLSFDESIADPPFRSMEIDWGKRKYTAIESGSEARSCTAALSGKEAVALLTTLRNADAVLIKIPDPCANSSDTTERTVKWLIHEAKPPNTQGSVSLTAGCAKQHPVLAKPFEVAEQIFKNGSQSKDCN